MSFAIGVIVGGIVAVILMLAWIISGLSPLIK